MYITTFNVKGSGFFPLTMLQRDACYPATDKSVEQIHTSERSERTIQLKAMHPRKDHMLNVSRWISFGWEVDVIQTRKIT
jgi:hypothetical protein